MKRNFFYYLSSLIFVFVNSGNAFGEVWLCEDLPTGKKTFTTAPINSNKSKCLPDATARASFMRLPPDEFSRWGVGEEVSLATSSAHTGEDEKEGKTADERAIRGTRKATKRKQTKDAQLFVTHSFREIDLRSNKTTSRGMKLGCEVKGKAKGSVPGVAQITITRGALTVNELRISIPKDLEEVEWQTKLKGPCRNPEVEIQPG